MSFYFPNVDPAYIYKRRGDDSDPYISLHETAQVVNGIVTLREIPEFSNKVIVKKIDGTTLTEITTDTILANQYRVDYSTGVVYLHSTLESNKLTFDYKGTGYVSLPANRIWLDTGIESSNKTLQQMFTDIDNIKTNWLTAVTTYANIATTYPTPKLGDTVQTIDDSKIYRFNGSGIWVNTQQYSANAITDVQNRIGNINNLETSVKDNLVNAINSNNDLLAELKKKTDWVDVSKYGYDTNAVKSAIATLKDGDVLYFPNSVAPYQLLGEPIYINIPNITVKGNGLLQMEYGFRPTESGFTIDGLRIEATRYHTDARAIKVDIPPTFDSTGVSIGTPKGSYATLTDLQTAYPTGTTGYFTVRSNQHLYLWESGSWTDKGTYTIKNIRNFVVSNCKFKNFFYAADFRGGTYEVTGNETAEGFPVRDVMVFNNYSETYVDMGGGNTVEKNAGHFNCTQVENITYAFNRTYGGRNATSYNTIKGNGFLKIIGNYDDSNTYGSCEAENITGKVVIQGNTFKKAIWIDDSNNVVIDGNYTDDVIKVTSGSNNYVADNITISNNTAKQIRAEIFGAYYGGYSNNLMISTNTLNGSGSYGIFIDGKYVGFAVVHNNMITGTYSSGKIGIVRGSAWVSSTNYVTLTFDGSGNLLNQGSIVNANNYTWLCVGAGTSGVSFPTTNDWSTGTTYSVGDYVISNNRTYKCTIGGVAGSVAPTQTSGTSRDGADGLSGCGWIVSDVSDGTCTWRLTKKTIEALLRHNIINGTVVISGSGGKVYKDNNFGTTWNGSTDTLTYS